MANIYSDYAIKIKRPLVFLCGPAITPSSVNERRTILHKYIITQFQEKDSKGDIIYQPIPVIVDDILSSPDINKNNLMLSLLEEIVSSISFKTYIFLDTISTAMELGLFSSSGSRNKVKVFIPESYCDTQKGRAEIGEFVTNSIYSLQSNIRLVKYQAKIEEISQSGYASKWYTNFINAELPDEIKKDLEDDNREIKSLVNQSFIEVEECRDIPENFSKVHFYYEEINHITFVLNFKMFFYIISSAIDITYRNLSQTQITDDLVLKSIDQIKEVLISIFINSKNPAIKKSIKAQYCVKKPNISIITNNTHDLFDLIKHIICLIKFIQFQNSLVKIGAKKIDSEALFSISPRKSLQNKYDFSVLDLFEINKNEYSIMSSYNKNQNKYLKHFYITIHGKKKKITTYSDNNYGLKIRRVHEKINKKLEFLFDSSPISYAYKKNQSIHSCIANHLHSNFFIKMDIHHFFDSIRYKKLLNVFRCLLDRDPNAMYSWYFQSKKYRRRYFPYSPVLDCEPLANLVCSLFYNKKLPIGFVSSPKVSDVFLSFFDKERDKSNIIVTRYSDDFLISSYSESEIFPVNLLKESLLIENDLFRLGLKLNRQKNICTHLVNIGDSIKFLGINIVKADIMNRLTISDKYIRNVCKEYCDYMKSKSISSFEKVIGKVYYIKYSSHDSFDKFKKLFKVKTGKTFQFIRL